MSSLTKAFEYSNIAGQVDSVFIFITVIGLFFFIITQGCLIYFAFRYRRKKGEEERETPYITGNRTLEIVWVVIPSLLIIAIFIYGWIVFLRIKTPPPDAQQINVTARQWLYQFKYPDGRQDVNQVVVPVGKPVKFVMTSQDVLHGFFFPALRVMQDIVPGRYTFLWVQPLKVGKYDIFCTQYCGTGHSVMRATMLVMNENDYAKWQAERTEHKEESVAERGKELVERFGCLACHSVDGTAKVGPTFKDLFGRKVDLTDGTSVNADDNYIRESIVDPGAKVVKGFQPIMPTYKGTATDEDISAIIAYIRSLNPPAKVEREQK